jgi:hypothetical protein
MEIEIEFIGDGSGMIRVRMVGGPLWDDLKPGDIHDDSGWVFEELRPLGEGKHEVEKRPMR